MSLDVGPALRTALLAEPTIAGLLSEFHNEASIHTVLPVPAEVVPVFIVIGSDVTLTDFDALISRRPIVQRDIFVYGAQPDDFRDVEQIGYSIRELFHRERFSITLTDYDVVEIVASGPRPAPTSDEETTGRVVTLTISLREKP